MAYYPFSFYVSGDTEENYKNCKAEQKAPTMSQIDTECSVTEPYFAQCFAYLFALKLQKSKFS